MLIGEALERRLLLFRRCDSKAELHAWVYTFLEVDLPDRIVDDRSNCSPMQMVWECYAHFMHPPAPDVEQPAERLYYASRFGGKTLSVSIIEVLVMLHAMVGVTHGAAIERQSNDAQGYLKAFFHKPDLRGFMIGDNVRLTQAVFYRPIGGVGAMLTEAEFEDLPPGDQPGYARIARGSEVAVASIKSMNGKHDGLLVLDEADLIPQPVINEAKNIPTPVRRPDGTFIMPLTIITSTRKTAFGPVQAMIDKANETGLVIGHWNILTATQHCPPTRNRRDLPKLPIYRSDTTLKAVDTATYEGMPPRTKDLYVKDEGFQGCLTNCRIFASCRGRLATHQFDEGNEFLKPLVDTAQKLRSNSLDMARAQLLCLKPSSTGLIYGAILEPHHVITPAEAFAHVAGRAGPTDMVKADMLELVKEFDVAYYGGQDYGYGHLFAFVVGFRFGNRLYFVRAPAFQGLNPSERIVMSEPLKTLDLTGVWGDTAEPGTIDMFRKHGWRMRTWSKLKNSVRDGINIFKAKLAPVDGPPEIYFVRDLGDDPEMDLFLRHLREYHWILDAAGQPTGEPDDENDDLPDAGRYLVMNLFPQLVGRVSVGANPVSVLAPTKDPTVLVGGKSPFMQAIITELTGATPMAQTGSVRKGKGRLQFI